MCILARFRDISKLLDESPYDDDYIVETAFPVVEKMLEHILDTTYTITMTEATDPEEADTYSTGDVYVDEIAACFVSQFAYETVDWGSTIDGKAAADKYNQMGMRLISYVYPSKIVYNPYHNRFYPKDKDRGVAYDSIEFDDGADDY